MGGGLEGHEQWELGELLSDILILLWLKVLVNR